MKTGATTSIAMYHRGLYIEMRARGIPSALHEFNLLSIRIAEVCHETIAARRPVCRIGRGAS